MLTTNAAVPDGPSGRPTSLLDTTSAASAAMPWPSWAPNIMPPSCVIIGAIGPACSAISGGMADDIAATTRPATGSHSADQVPMVFSTQSTWLQASMVVTPDGRSVASSSQRSASRTDSVTAERSAEVTGRWVAARPEIASCRARSQFTGPPLPDSRR